MNVLTSSFARMRGFGRARPVFPKSFFFAGIGFGAALMFLLDPTGGGRRRALVRDKAGKAARSMQHGVQRAGRDLANRAKGALAEGRAARRREEVPDHIIEERVRSELGHVMAHPSGIRIESRNGVVELKGQVLPGEHDRVLGVVRAIPGVRDIDDDLETFAHPETKPTVHT